MIICNVSQCKGDPEDLSLVGIAPEKLLEQSEEQCPLLTGSAFKEENMPLSILAPTAGPSTSMDTDLLQVIFGLRCASFKTYIVVMHTG